MAINIFPRVDVTGTNRWSPLRKGHWSTRGLVLSNAFGQGASAWRVGRAVTVGGGYSTAVASANASPKGANFTNAAHHVEIATPNLPTTRATVLVVRQCADTTLRDGVLFGNNVNAGNTTQRCLAHVPFSDGNVYWDFGGSGLTGGRVSAAYSKTTQVEAWAFVSGRAGSSIWRNGVRIGNQTTAFVGMSGFTWDFQVNAGAATSGGGDLQQVHFIALLDAEWIPAQIQEWSANPWLMFESGRLGVPTSAALASTARAFATFFG